ncbi:MAG: EAL domain-containing protein [Hyphomicrobiales bacterium]|nr:EAL domain-containing protein [Hyphomicrobiales bacterium]
MRLKYRIAATIFVLEILLIAAVLSVTLGYARDSVLAQHAESEDAMLITLANLSRSALLTEDYGELQSFVEISARDPRIDNIILVDGRGTIVVSTIPDLIGEVLPPQVEEQTDTQGENDYWREIQVEGYSNTLGNLVVEISRHELVQLHRDIRNLAFVVAGLGIVASALIGLAIGGVLTRRLQRLANAADNVTEGTAPAPLHMSGDDEVARVARAFSSMVQRLQSNMSEIRRTKDLLVEPTEAMSQGFAVWDANDRLMLCNKRFRELFKEIANDIRYETSFADFCTLARRSIFSVGSEEATAHHWRTYRTLVARGQPQNELEFQCCNGRWLEIRESRTGEGGLVGIYTDVTAEKDKEQALYESDQRLREIMSSVLDTIVTTSADGTIASVNQAVEHMFYWPTSEIIGRPIGSLLALKKQTQAGTTILPCEIETLVTMCDRPLLELWGIRRNGHAFPIEVSVSQATQSSHHAFIFTARDITERKAAEQKIVYHATHDHLTGLPNRSDFVRRLSQAVERTGDGGERLAVMFLDLDRFKVINDSLGHPVGDALLIAVAKRLRRNIRRSDVVARLGGDEFCFLVRDVDIVTTASTIGEKIVQAMKTPFLVNGHELHVTASIGISLCPEHGCKPDQLLKHADVALYQAKARGKNQFCLFAAGMSDDSHRQMIYSTHLRHAIDRNQMHTVYQPQVDIRSGRIVGVEALLRWVHPSLGSIPPSRFIPIAEETGMISHLGALVLQTTCDQFKIWQKHGVSPLRVAINLSARQFRDPFLADRIETLITNLNIDPSLIEFELTESDLLEENELAHAFVSRLTNMGMGLVLDDFGTGYSSLSHLKLYPIRRIKIDRSFVRDIELNANDAALVRATVAIADCLGTKVIAEGIETKRQMELVLEQGCNEAQGFYLYPPMKSHNLTRILTRLHCKSELVEFGTNDNIALTSRTAAFNFTQSH